MHAGIHSEEAARHIIKVKASGILSEGQTIDTLWHT